MYPNIFSTCAQNAGVQAVFGTNPTRFYPFGEAPQGTALPYAVFQVVTGSPENYVDCAPDIDTWSIQIDVYDDTVSGCRDAAEALRDAIEPVAHIVGWRGEERDSETRRYRFSFDVDWWESRSEQS